MNKLLSQLLLATLLFSCRQAPETINPQKPGSFDSGYFIPCEGTYGFGNASVSFYNTKGDSVFNDVFKAVNKKDLGDQLQSMSIYNGRGYLVVQNSQKIEVVDISNFEYVATIKSDNSLSSPRYFVGISPSKAYISDWNADALAIIDLKTNQVRGSIPVGTDPDEMLLANGRLFVANSGYASINNNDNRISVIDTATDKLIQHITVCDRPMSMVLDKRGKLWVACKGFKKYNSQGNFSEESSPGSLYQINPINFAVEKNFAFSSYNDSPDNLAIDPKTGDLFYTNKGRLWKQTVESTALENTLVYNRDFTGIAFDANQNLLACESPNFTSPGKILKFNNLNMPIDSTEVGIGPNAFVLK